MEIIIKFIVLLMKIFDYITGPIFRYKARNLRQYLPPLKDDLVRISATDLAQKIRTKQLSSLDICNVYIERIKSVNPILNAVVEERFSAARKEAKQVEGYLNTTSLSVEELEKMKPLLGVPITIKESCSVKDMSLCVGLRCRKGFKAESDGEAVRRIKSSGAIILLVSATPELSLSWETFSYVNGYTNNPYNTTCTPGGSSGGEGALLGSGASLIGIGADLAGSIRLPAMFNGIFGHKPTPKLVSLKGHWPVSEDEKYQEFLVIGPMARYACDLRLMMRVLCSDKVWTDLKLNDKVNFSKLNVFFLEDFDGSLASETTKDVKSVIRKCVKYLRNDCGSKVSNYKFSSFNRAMIVNVSEIYSIKDVPDAIKWENTSFCIELVKTLFGKSRLTRHLMFTYFVGKIYKYLVGDYSEENAQMKEEVITQLGTNGVIIMPTSMGSAFKHNQMFFKLIYPYLVVANSLGLPSTAVPCGFDRDGMPIGVQVIAAPAQDRLCLAVAEKLETYFGGWVPPPEKD